MTRKELLVLLGLLIGTAAVLLSFGRSPWCPQGDLSLWSFALPSPHNSQHIVDWYTPSHISHGLIFALLIRWFLPEISIVQGLVIALSLESAWEVLENTDFIINRYREETLALDYYGDSVANSIADIMFCAMGFLFAARMPISIVLLILVTFELATLYFIRDNLTLNVIMLLYPLEVIKEWQVGG
jgi:hypothetical protein